MDGIPKPEDCTAHNRSRVGSGAVGVQVAGSAEPWSYAVSFDLKHAVASLAQSCLIAVEVEVLAGAVTIGVVEADFSTFLDEVRLERKGAASVERVELVVDVPSRAAALVVRTAERAEAPEFVIRHLRLGPVSRLHPWRRRGFHAEKEPIADLSFLLDGHADVIVDVGANVGDTVAAFSRHFPKTRILAFEPHPQVVEELVQRFAGSPEVEVHECALGAQSGRMTLHSFANSATNSLRPMADEAALYTEGAIEAMPPVEVPVRTLAEVCSGLGVEHIDILKLDTQGFERDVLAGAETLLRSGKIKIILCEVLFVPLYKGQAMHFEIASTLHGYGYQVYDYYSFRHSPDGQVKWGDAVFLKTGTRP
ncbi:FkbM family methyltransferase [Azospirillum palustre]|uniref:FkbM family methyltransferase n=1 Tax=Azospirillum palustre TaxID=2044885 RepID=UPI00137A3273|nr:FkbM family methyltransferase [Azospirillum palustre]